MSIVTAISCRNKLINISRCLPYIRDVEDPFENSQAHVTFRFRSSLSPAYPHEIMSRVSAPSARAPIASRISFAALQVESGEESEEDEVVEEQTPIDKYALSIPIWSMHILTHVPLTAAL